MSATDVLLAAGGSGSSIGWFAGTRPGSERIIVAQGIAVSRTTGDIYVTGYVITEFSGTYYEGLAIKYNTAGEVVWAKKISDLSESGNVVVYEPLLDEDDNLYFSGYHSGSAVTLVQMLVKMDKDGNLIWQKDYYLNGASLSSNSQIALDSSRNIYVSGTGGRLVKFDNDGNVVWHYTSALFVYDVKVDSNDDLFLTGYINYNPGTGSKAYQVVQKLDSSCNVIWTTAFSKDDGAGNPETNTSSRSMAFLPNGEIVLTGIKATVADPTINNPTLSKMSADGSSVSFLRVYGPSAPVNNSFFYGASVDSSGNLYFISQGSALTGAASMGVFKFDSTQTLEWSRKIRGGLLITGTNLALSSDGVPHTIGFFNGTVSPYPYGILMGKVFRNGDVLGAYPLFGDTINYETVTVAEQEVDVIVASPTAEPVSATYAEEPYSLEYADFSPQQQVSYME